MVLNTYISRVRAQSPVGFKIKNPFRHGISFSVVCHFFTIYKDNGPWSVECYLRSVPLRTREAGFGKRLCKRIQCSRIMVLILIRQLGLVVYLYLVTVMYRHPFFPWFKRNAYKNTGVAVLVPHLPDYPDHAVAELLSGPV